MKTDFQELEVERARIQVSIQEARDIVTQWMGDDFTEADNGIKIKYNENLSSTAGLGFQQEKEPEFKQLALEKLKRMHAAKQKTEKEALDATSRHSIPRSANPQLGENKLSAKSVDFDDDEESRSSIKLGQRQKPHLKPSKIGKRKLIKKKSKK